MEHTCQFLNQSVAGILNNVRKDKIFMIWEMVLERIDPEVTEYDESHFFFSQAFKVNFFYNRQCNVNDLMTFELDWNVQICESKYDNLNKQKLSKTVAMLRIVSLPFAYQFYPLALTADILEYSWPSRLRGRYSLCIVASLGRVRIQWSWVRIPDYTMSHGLSASYSTRVFHQSENTQDLYPYGFSSYKLSRPNTAGMLFRQAPNSLTQSITTECYSQLSSFIVM